MAWMEAEGTRGYLRVECRCGATSFVPVDMTGDLRLAPGASRDATDTDRAALADYLGSVDGGGCCLKMEAHEITHDPGILCHLSASGYMDQTDWSPHDGTADTIGDGSC